MDYSMGEEHRSGHALPRSAFHLVALHGTEQLILLGDGQIGEWSLVTIS